MAPMLACGRADGRDWMGTARLRLCFQLRTAFQDWASSWGHISSRVPLPCEMPLLPWQIFLSLFAQPVQGQREAPSM